MKQMPQGQTLLKNTMSSNEGSLKYKITLIISLTSYFADLREKYNFIYFTSILPSSSLLTHEDFVSYCVLE